MNGDLQGLVPHLRLRGAPVYVYVLYNRCGAVHDGLSNIVFQLALYLCCTCASLGLLLRLLLLAAMVTHAPDSSVWCCGDLRWITPRDEQRRLLCAPRRGCDEHLCGALRAFGPEVPATQLAHMLGISLFGWSLLEIARSGVGRGFGFLRGDSLTALWQAGGVQTGVYASNSALSLGQLALVGFVLDTRSLDRRCLAGQSSAGPGSGGSCTSHSVDSHGFRRAANLGERRAGIR